MKERRERDGQTERERKRVEKEIKRKKERKLGEKSGNQRLKGTDRQIDGQTEMVEGAERERGRQTNRCRMKKGERRKPRGINIQTGYVSDGQRETQKGRGERKIQRDRHERGKRLDNLLVSGNTSSSLISLFGRN